MSCDKQQLQVPQTRTIHMQEKATEEVTTVPKKTTKMCLFKAEIASIEHHAAKLPENIGVSVCRGSSSSHSLSLLGWG